ncbi:MAG: hypothetical protein KTR26_12660 [Flammeovirgaceae bacterium]|nr:hypothetical protein [Flammeovirgaceae bacterium]
MVLKFQWSEQENVMSEWEGWRREAISSVVRLTIFLAGFYPEQPCLIAKESRDREHGAPT